MRADSVSVVVAVAAGSVAVTDAAGIAGCFVVHVRWLATGKTAAG